MTGYYNRLRNIVWSLCLLALSVPVLAQTADDKKLQARNTETKTSKISGSDLLDAQRRTFALSLVTSLAEEARSYQDLALRPRVLANAADTIWPADSDAARVMFRRAWEAAEKADTQEVTLKSPVGVPPAAAPMVTALRRISGHDLRAEVLALAARRDRALAEEFLNKLKVDTKREVAETKNGSNHVNASDGWSDSEASSKRLQLARRLLAAGQIERALEFAAPLLDRVNANSINFLSTLRERMPEAADQRYASLLTLAEFDPSSDANTASGLSSYAFTPGLYVTFSADGNVRWSQPEGTTAPPNLHAALRNMFFKTAASILLRPLPPPDQDFTSSGRTGKLMVVNRLLPLFDQYAPDMAMALRSQLGALLSDGPVRGREDSPLLTQGLQQEEKSANPLAGIQDRLDHAKTSAERDRIYADAAVALADQRDVRAQDLADKIADADRRGQVRRHVDFQFVQIAIRKKEAAEVARTAKAGQLSHTQRVWAYTQAARLLMNSDRLRSLEILEEGVSEARRIDANDPDRARVLIGVAKQLVTADRVRSWEILGEAVTAANAAERFTGENVQLHFSMLATKSGVKITSVSGEDFSLSGVLRSLAKDDFDRSIDLAKSFKNTAPRATAILAIADSVLNK